jgi:alpha-galactosidase
MKAQGLCALILGLSLCTALLPASRCAARADQTPILLDDLDLAGMAQGWGSPQASASVSGAPLRVAGESFDSGVGTHAPAAWKLPLAGKATEFRGKVGVQEYVNNPGVGSVEFIVRGDGRELWRSGVMRGKDSAKDVRVSLAGVKELTLEVTDGGDGNSSDHADWLEAVILHDGAPLPMLPGEPLLADEPGDPENAATKVEWNEQAGTLQLHYDGKLLFDGRVTGKATLADTATRKQQALTQTLTLTGKGLRLEGLVNTSSEAIAAETRGAAQEKFPLVRTTSGGPSRNLRNNAIYDRSRDWMLAGAAQTRPKSATQFTFSSVGDSVTLTFKPRFYQRHKNIAYFRPWTYRVRQDSITGWSSWWAFMRNCSQQDCDELLAVWKEKRFAGYGYRFIQLDDCFQNEFGKGQARKVWPPAVSGNSGYVARGPATWLDWRKDSYPAGMSGYVAACKTAGFEPAIWIGTYFTDDELITRHPDWFIRGADGKPFAAPWSSCGADATSQEALDAIVRPTFRGLREAGFSYVKIDQLRHYLYDNLHQNPAYCTARGVTPAEMFRKYLGAAREELGKDTFILSCWGVLPESVGLADACRIGGDGYGPVTMQQYNSWNGLVWRNDPDHCDVYPKFKPAEAGNVTKTAAVAAAPADTIIRPALASIAGCVLLLSDKPAVYRDDANLAGLRRAAPVLFSVPGQLYDFDESKTRKLATLKRTAITSGANPSPIDADQFGAVCPWWLNEFDRPFEHWNVLHRLNWSNKPTDQTEVRFAGLGLDPDKTWLVYEFWLQKFLGAFRERVELPALGPMGLASFAIREQLDRPQLISTSRHLSQGGVDLVAVEWADNTLSGRSRVVAGDRYEVTVRVPTGFKLKSTEVAGQPAEAVTDGECLRLAWRPAATEEVDWKLLF